MKEIKAIAFDIDGTLYPNWRLNIRVLPYFLKNIRFFLAFKKVRDILHQTAPLGDFFEYQAQLL
ncbi:MAG TPA: HAD family hydrolase, partial [Treponema sp.]|nr:HAD family hydrolase [Treponema sp.]